VRARYRPPASISGSCRGSPTSTTFTRCPAAWWRRRASCRVPTMPASSTIRTDPAGNTPSSPCVRRRSRAAMARQLASCGAQLDQLGRIVREHAVGELFDVVDCGSGRQPLGDGLEQITAGERRRLLRERFTVDQLASQPGDVRRLGCRASRQLGVPAVAEPETPAPLPPPCTQLGLRQPLTLRLPGLEGRHLGSGGGGLATGGQVFDNRGPSLGELLDHLGADALQVGVAVDDRTPRQPKPPGQLMPQLRLIIGTRPSWRARTAGVSRGSAIRRRRTSWRGWRRARGCVAADRSPATCDAETRPRRTRRP
jgi:hypothetical protein